MKETMFWIQMLQMIFILWIARHINLFQSLSKFDRMMGVLVVGFALYHAGKKFPEICGFKKAVA